MNGVVELRQYTLHPGQREVLVELFEREFVESQEECGMRIIGTFRDLDNPDRFVWLRGFPDMTSRLRGLQSFYSGPIWKANSAAANATMVDVNNVLLLRPVSDFPPPLPRPPVGGRSPDSVVTATIHYGHSPFSSLGSLGPALAEAGVEPLACLQTEYAENTFPALPVRTGEHVFVWFARFDNRSALAAAEAHWPAVMPGLRTQRLRLAPTPRSALR